jgi:hypothetical protein
MREAAQIAAILAGHRRVIGPGCGEIQAKRAMGYGVRRRSAALAVGPEGETSHPRPAHHSGGRPPDSIKGASMNLGKWRSVCRVPATSAACLEWARRAEDLGYESIWIAETGWARSVRARRGAWRR